MAAPRRGQLQAAFESAAAAGADAAFARAAHTLDGYAGGWIDMHTSACEATRLRGEQSEELLDLRMQCLTERLDALRATVDVLAAADSTVVARASSGAAGQTRRLVDQIKETYAQLPELAGPERAGFEAWLARHP